MSKLVEQLFGASTRINSKKKGERNGRSLAKVLSQWSGEEFVRVPASGGLRWQNTFNSIGDLVPTNQDFYWPFCIETKHLAKLHTPKELSANSAIYKLWQQPLNDIERAGKGIPIMFLRADGMPNRTWYVIISDEFMFYPPCETLFAGSSLRGYDSKELLKRINYTDLCNLIKVSSMT